MLNFIRTQTYTHATDTWTVEIYEDTEKDIDNFLVGIVKKNGNIVTDMPLEFQSGTLIDVSFGGMEQLLNVVQTICCNPHH